MTANGVVGSEPDRVAVIYRDSAAAVACRAQAPVVGVQHAVRPQEVAR